MRILLIEDEKGIADFVANGLRAERFAVDWAATAEKGLLLAKVNPYDAGVFDIRLSSPILPIASQKILQNKISETASDETRESGREGLGILKEVRAKGKIFPIIMLSVTSDAQTKVDALNLGADDYLTKPFSMAELTARIRALLRREKKITEQTLLVADLALDTRAHTVTRGGKRIVLNRKEFALLEYFMRNPGTMLTRSMILDHVWDMNVDPFTNTVDVHMRFLREKIDDGHKKKLLKTVHGYGYKIEE
jgi:DNA-binding response OmpR family regulator